jgi:hypothetical protein
MVESTIHFDVTGEGGIQRLALVDPFKDGTLETLCVISPST